MVTSLHNDTAGVGEVGAARVLFFDAVIGLWSNATAAAEADLLAAHPTQTWMAVSAFLLLYAFWTSSDRTEATLQLQRVFIAIATVGGIAISTDWALADPLATADAVTAISLVTFATFLAHRGIRRATWGTARRAVGHVATATVAVVATVMLLANPHREPAEVVDASATTATTATTPDPPVIVRFPSDDECEHGIGEGDHIGISPAQALALQDAAASTDDTTCGRLPAQDLGAGVAIQFVDSGLLIAHEDGRGHPIWQRHIFGLLMVSTNLEITELGGIPDGEIPCGDGDLVLFVDAQHHVVAISLRPRHFTSLGEHRPQIPLPPAALPAFVEHVDEHGWSWPVELVREASGGWTVILENDDRVEVPPDAPPATFDTDDLARRCPAPVLPPGAPQPVATLAPPTDGEAPPEAAAADSSTADAADAAIDSAIGDALDDAMPDSVDQSVVDTAADGSRVEINVDVDVTIELPATDVGTTPSTTAAP